MTTMAKDLAWGEIRQAREYTLRLLDGLRADDWFRMPPGGVSHIGWQVGHLAMAQYRMCLVRMRDERPEDAELLRGDFLKHFSMGTTPQADASVYPPADEILATLDRVYAQSQLEIAQFPHDDLESAPLRPHPLFNTKLSSLFWCARHEMLHAGQIGLLRRQLGYEPKW